LRLVFALANHKRPISRLQPPQYKGTKLLTKSNYSDTLKIGEVIDHGLWSVQDANAGFFLSLDESSPTKHLFGYMSGEYSDSCFNFTVRDPNGLFSCNLGIFAGLQKFVTLFAAGVFFDP
jgi:hypothetical protein